MDAVIRCDAEGIGLFRSEFLYLERDDLPDEETQFLAYKEVAQRMTGKKVIIRTLDIGADKQAGYLKMPAEENPAMGMRAIRICLTHPDIFITQLRALYRASAFGDISIMLPMISSVQEVMRVKKIASEVKAGLKAEGVAYNDKTELGIMVETPAAAILSDILAEEVDFFSLGTNDLTQYTLACDRQNQTIAEFCDPHSEAVIRLISTTIRNAHKAGIWCGICGELAADETLTETLLRMGVDELSVAPSYVLPLRKRIANMDLSIINTPKP
jgi:phosphotransferase system enzyme I (PtsI)